MIETYVAALLGICGIIATIGGAVAVIVRMLSPFRAIKERLDKHDRLLDNDNKRIESIEKMMREMCQSIVVLLDHAASGNSIEKCAKRRDELVQFLAKR